MVELQEEAQKKVRALLVGSRDEPEELRGLVDTMGMECAGTVVLTRIEPTPAYGIGKGKVTEILDTAKMLFADCIIFDWDIDPTKQRNWEKASGIPVFDRNEVILRIFAQRAQTKEAVLQVELARLTYSLPRLSHMYGDMARQRGGSYGAKGSGETQLELDRRQVEEKIIQIKKELSHVQMNRDTQRKQRERTEKASCALVGYTNAGKSSLLNALTGADVFVEDKLFATLDPTTRKLSLAEGSTVLLTDTVGFISNLPHTLINAFKSTLDEAARATLLLIVVDASDGHRAEQYAQVQNVLKEINASEVPALVVLNKMDAVHEQGGIELAELDAQFPGALKVSARTGQGFDALLAAITERLSGSLQSFVIPMEQMQLVELARKNGTIAEEQWLDDGVHVTARIPQGSRTLALLAPYAVG